MSTDSKDYKESRSNPNVSAGQKDSSVFKVVGSINGLALHHSQTFENMSNMLAHANRHE